jgi:hypothetical protein
MKQLIYFILILLLFSTTGCVWFGNNNEDLSVEPVYVDPQDQNRAFSRRNTIRYVMPVVNGRLAPDCTDPYRCGNR